MTELQRALFEILLKLREILGEGAARKNLGGTAGDYFNHMLGWLGRRLNERPPPPRTQWSSGRAPNTHLIGVVMGAAVKCSEFQRSSDVLVATIKTYQSIDGFPNPTAILQNKPGPDAWCGFFQELVRRACAKKKANPIEQQRPPWLILPERRWMRGVDQPGLLLRADNKVVPFHGRDEELRDLQCWCDEGPKFRLRCYTGAGGMGKTRLGLELCRRMSEEGWLCGLVRADLLPAGDSARNQMPSLRVPALLVVDYAEHHRKAVLELIHWSNEARQQTRILLLARSAGEWWELAHEDKKAGPALRMKFAENPIELNSMAMKPEERRQLFDLAAETFAETLERDAPKRTSRSLEEPYFDKILWLHMAALLKVDNKEVSGEDGVLDEVLRRERRYWRKVGEALKIPSALLRLIGRAVCVLTANEGAADLDEAVGLLRGIPGFRDQTEAILESVATLLHECFPGQKWIEPLQPDELGDRLFEQEIDRIPNLLADFGCKP